VVRAEKASGSRRDGRTELQVLLDFVQPGNTLVVTRIDRLARFMKDLQDIQDELRQISVSPTITWRSHALVTVSSNSTSLSGTAGEKASSSTARALCVCW